MTRRVVERLLIVEDHEGLRTQLSRALTARAGQIVTAGSVAEAKATLLVPPDLVVLDVALPDGDAFDVLAALATISPLPVVVAMSGSATTPEGFRLAQLGVRGFVHKPVNLEELDAAIESALAGPPELSGPVRAAVGHVSLEDVEDVVRDALVDEALARAGGSKHAAARLLSITRQRLQHILRKREAPR